MGQRQVCWIIISMSYDNEYFGIVAIRKQGDLGKN